MSSKIIVKLIKNEDDPWILTKQDLLPSLFTQEEIATHISPFFAYIRTLPGYLAEEASNVIEGNISTTTIAFDTYENMLNGKEKLFGDDLDETVVNKNNFFKQKMQEANVTYIKQITYDSPPNPENPEEV